MEENEHDDKDGTSTRMLTRKWKLKGETRLFVALRNFCEALWVWAAPACEYAVSLLAPDVAIAGNGNGPHLLLSIVTVLLLLLLQVKIGSKETFEDEPRRGASNISIVAAFEIYPHIFLSIVSNVLAVANVIFFALALCHILRAGLRPLDLVSSSPRLQSIRPTMPCDP